LKKGEGGLKRIPNELDPRSTDVSRTRTWGSRKAPRHSPRCYAQIIIQASGVQLPAGLAQSANLNLALRADSKGEGRRRAEREGQKAKKF